MSKAVSHFTLEVVQPRVISFEDQVVFLDTSINDAHCYYWLLGIAEFLQHHYDRLVASDSIWPTFMSASKIGVKLQG